MIAIRPANARGVTDFGWLDSRHTFAFGEYRDPANMGFRTLRVINDDRIAPGGGFPTHPHRDMEIVTWVLEGALEHKDSLGTGSVIRAGDLQRMTAGTGISHSEFNPSPSSSARLLQIWIFPEARGLVPGYDQQSFPAAERLGQLKLVASRTGRDGSISLAQDADLYLMDEPFASVDAATERAIVEVLRDLRGRGKTVVCVHHDLSTVPEYFDHVALLNMRVSHHLK